MLDRIFVDYFGTATALNQIARVSTSGAQQIVIEPFDKAVCKEIEKAISNSDLNLTANNDGTGIIRINVRIKITLALLSFMFLKDYFVALFYTFFFPTDSSLLFALIRVSYCPI
jgi:hypothetical protein